MRIIADQIDQCSTSQKLQVDPNDLSEEKQIVEGFHNIFGT